MRPFRLYCARREGNSDSFTCRYFRIDGSSNDSRIGFIHHLLDDGDLVRRRYRMIHSSGGPAVRCRPISRPSTTTAMQGDIANLYAFA